jgi:hypothetical protein
VFIGKGQRIVWLIYLILFCLSAVLVVGLVLLFVPAKVGDVRLAGVSPDHAYDLIAVFSNGTYDSRFGYPSGFFSLNERKSRPGQHLVYSEMQPSAAASDGCAREAGSLAFAGTGSGPLGCVMTFIAVSFIAGPFMIASFADRVCRNTLKSQISVSLAADGVDTVASFAFRGVSAYFVKDKFIRAFAEPVLPPGLFPQVEEPSVVAS